MGRANLLSVFMSTGLVLSITGTAPAEDHRWEFDEKAQTKDWVLSGLEDKGVAEGVWRLTATAGNPMLFTPKAAIDAANQMVVTFRMKLGKGIASNGCLLFVTDTQIRWDDKTIVSFPCQSDGEFHTYDVDMSKNPLWKGRVRQLRLQPMYMGWPMPEEHRVVEIDHFRVPDLAAGAAAVPVDKTPFHVLTREVVTDHIAWAEPWAGGAVKVLATPVCRDVVELAQRLSIDFATWRKFEEGDNGAGNAVMNDLYYGRQERALIASYQELASKVAGDPDVILMGQQRWGKAFSWEGLPALLKKAILEKVRGGAGLIYVRPSPEARTGLAGEAEKEMPLPGNVLAGVPYAGLAVLDRDVKGTGWLKCFALGKGRIALVDYQNEFFGAFEAERSFRRGATCPFTPDVTYDARSKPFEYEYHQSLLAKLVLWAGGKEGQVTFSKLAVEKGRLTADIANAGKAETVATEIIVRDGEGTQETALRGQMTLAAGANILTSDLGPLKAGKHFADLWLRGDGKTIAWGSTCFETQSEVNLAAMEADKPFYRPAETVNGKLVLDREAPAEMKVRLQLADSFGRLLSDQTVPIAGKKELGFTLSLAGAEAILHHIRASLLQSDRIVCEKNADVLVRRTPVVDDYIFSFWAPLQNNDRGSRYMLKDLSRKGFTEAYIGYMYTVPGAQLEPALKATVAEDFDLSFFAYSLAAWNAGSDPTATVSPRCLTQEAFRQNLFAVLKQHAATGRRLPVFGYSLGDEAGISGYGQDYCFSPTCLAYLRTYLKSAYGTLEALNAEWGTAFVGWEAVTPMTKAQAVKHGNFAPWVDHRMAMESMFAGLVYEAGEAVRTVDPSGRVGTEGITGGGMYGNGGEDSFVGYDFGKIFPAGQHWGVYFQHYPQIEYLRSFASADSVRFTYTQPFEEYPGGYFRDAWTNEKVNRFVPWYDLLNGMNGTMYWGSLGTDWYAFYSADYRPTPWSKQIAETIQEINRGVGKLLLNARRDHCGIAIFYSPASFHVQTILGGRERYESPKAFCRALEDLGLQYDFVSSQQMAAGKLGDYKVLVLPYSYAIGKAEAEQIRAFVAKGGHIIADGTPGVMDGHGKKAAKPVLSGVKVQVCTNPVWKYNDPTVRNGQAGAACREEIGKALEAAGVEPQFKIVPKDGKELLGCEVVHFTAGGAEYLAILQGREYIQAANENHDPAPVTIALPRKAHVYSVRDGKHLGETNSIETGIEPAVAKVYALLPAKVESLVLAGIKNAYERGSAVGYAVESKTLPQIDIPQVFHVEVKKPGGDPCRLYARNLHAPKGKAQGAFTLALNDVAGDWTITVTDVASGKRAQKSFSVRQKDR